MAFSTLALPGSEDLGFFSKRGLSATSTAGKNLRKSLLAIPVKAPANRRPNPSHVKRQDFLFDRFVPHTDTTAANDLDLLNFYGSVPCSEELEDLFELVAGPIINADGTEGHADKITFEDFKSWCESMLIDESEQIIRQAWTEMDEKGKMRLTKPQFLDGVRSNNTILRRFFRRLCAGYLFQASAADDLTDPAWAGKRRKTARSGGLLKVDLKTKEVKPLDYIHDTLRDMTQCLVFPFRANDSAEGKAEADRNRLAAIFAMGFPIHALYLGGKFPVASLTVRSVCMSAGFILKYGYPLVEPLYEKKRLTADHIWKVIEPGLKRISDPLPTRNYIWGMLRMLMYHCPPECAFELLTRMADFLRNPKSINESEFSYLRMAQILNFGIDSHQKVLIAEAKNLRNFIQIGESICTHLFNAYSHDATRSEALKLYSRIDALSSMAGTKVVWIEKQPDDVNKLYRREYGPNRITKYITSAKETTSSALKSSPTGSPREGSSPTSPSKKNKKIRQKWFMGEKAAAYARGEGRQEKGGKERAKDLRKREELQNPYECEIEPIDYEQAFRYADMDGDGEINLNDFLNSLKRVGLYKIEDAEAKSLFEEMSPSKVKDRHTKKIKKIIDRDTFKRIMDAYPTDTNLYKWLCRIMTYNHLNQGVFKTDPKLETCKALLKDTQRKTWRVRIDAVHAAARYLVRLTREQFKKEIRSWIAKLETQLREINPLVVRAASIATAKIFAFQRELCTKYNQRICKQLEANMDKNNDVIRHSSFMLYLSFIRFVPDNKNHFVLLQVGTMCQHPKSKMRLYGWQLFSMVFTRLAGMGKRNRPDSFWEIVTDILEMGKKESKLSVTKWQSAVIVLLDKCGNHDLKVKYENKVGNSLSEGLDENVRRMVEANVNDIQKDSGEIIDVFSLLEEQAGMSQNDESDSGGDDDVKFEDEEVDPNLASLMRGLQAGGGDHDQKDEEHSGPLMLHDINVTYVDEVYNEFNLETEYQDMNALHSALKYLDIQVARGELALLAGEMRTIQRGKWRQEDLAFFARHMAALEPKSWAPYHAATNLDDEDPDLINALAEITDGQAYLRTRVQSLQEMAESGVGDVIEKADIIQSLLLPFQDEALFDDHHMLESMADILHKWLFEALETCMVSMEVSEMCILLSRLVRTAMQLIEQYIPMYFRCLFDIMGHTSSNVVSNACFQTTMVIAKVIAFNQDKVADEACHNLAKQVRILIAPKLQLNVYYCIAQTILTNIALKKYEHTDVETCMVIWQALGTCVYAGLGNNDGSVRDIAIAMLAYMQSIKYHNFTEADNATIQMGDNAKIQRAIQDKAWLRIFEENQSVEDPIILDHGWDGLGGRELEERIDILSKWLALERGSDNAKGVTIVSDLLKSIANYKDLIGDDDEYDDEELDNNDE